MKISITVDINVNIDPKRISDRIMNDRPFWEFAATEWHRLYAPYVPMLTGTLTNTVSITPGQIEHTVPYARYQYEGTRFNFTRTYHPKASAHWDKAAEPTQKPKLIASLQAYINSGRIRLND